MIVDVKYGIFYDFMDLQFVCKKIIINSWIGNGAVLKSFSLWQLKEF